MEMTRIGMRMNGKKLREVNRPVCTLMGGFRTVSAAFHSRLTMLVVESSHSKCNAFSMPPHSIP